MSTPIHALLLGSLPGLVVLCMLRLGAFRPHLRHTLLLLGLAGPWLAIAARTTPLPTVGVHIPQAWMETAALVSPVALAGADAPARRPGSRAAPASNPDGTASAAPHPRHPASALLWLWWGVTGLLLLRLTLDMAAAERLVRASRTGPIPPSARAVAERPTRFVWSRSAQLPFAWGVRRPIVVLPEGAHGWTPERLRSVVLHELAHFERRDVVWGIFARVSTAVFWWNPVVWWLARERDHAAEQACDAAVIERGVQPSSYARAIVDLIRERRATPALAGFGSGRGRRLRGRLERVLKPRRRPERGSRGYAAAVGVVLTATTLVVPALPSGLPAPQSALVTGCRWAGGAHLYREAYGERTVAWEGPGCGVEYHAAPEVWTRFMAGGAGSLAPGDSMALSIERDGGLERRVLRVGASGVRVTSDGDTSDMTGVPAQEWAQRLRNELDLHTAVLAPQRVPEFLAEGGVERLLGFVRETQGDFAGSAYLDRLVRTHALDDGELRAVLRTAAEVGDNDAVLTELLVGIQERYDVATAAQEFAAAFSLVDATAAREAVLRAGTTVSDPDA